MQVEEKRKICEKNNMKKKKSIIRKCMGKGGLDPTPFKQASKPIDLLKSGGTPPTVAVLPKSKNNY